MAGNRRESSTFTCYFCKKTIENDTEMGHTAVCGSVLVPCPNKCGSYVPRSEMKKHNRKCVNRTSKSTSMLPTLNENVTTYANQEIPMATASLERNFTGYPKYDTRLQDEVTKLSRKLADLEMRHQHRQQNRYDDALTTNLIHNYESLKNSHIQQNLTVEKLKYQNNLIFDWKKNFEVQLNNFNHLISTLQNSKKKTDLDVVDIKDKIMIIDKMHKDITFLFDSIFKEKAYNKQVILNLEQDLNAFKGMCSQENAATATILNDQKVTLENIIADITNVKSIIDEQKSKFTNTIFDLKAASQIASEALEKIEILENNFAETKKEINQIKLDLEIVEGLTTSNDFNTAPGRLLWKITEIETKMQRAKDFDSVLKSPIFYTHEYGYKIRVLMYMNGLKKWKDRYALLCIHVLKGEYDMLLKWPCRIEGNITIRDLEDLEKTKPFSKFITAKRQCGDEENEEPQESSSTYIFIPHSTLLKSNHVKEDTMFIDVKILSNAKIETSL